jgi:hypothetical protein
VVLQREPDRIREKRRIQRVERAITAGSALPIATEFRWRFDPSAT